LHTVAVCGSAQATKAPGSQVVPSLALKAGLFVVQPMLRDAANASSQRRTI
jgi:hypothetical protein